MGKKSHWTLLGPAFHFRNYLGTGCTDVRTHRGHTASEAEPGSMQVPEIQMGMQCL